MQNLSHAHNNIIRDAVNSNNNGNGSGCNNPNYSHNTKNSNNTYNNFHFHFPETPTNAYMNGIIHSLNTIPSPNASNDNVDAQMAELLVSSGGETAEQPMEYQNEAGTDDEFLNEDIEEIEEMQNNMIDVKCNECSKLMAHFVSALDVYPKLKGWECDGVGCTEETGKLLFEEIYHCNCIEDGYDLCQKCATAIMMKANQKKKKTKKKRLSVSSDEDYPQNILQSTKYTASNTKSQNKNRKRKRSYSHSLEQPPNKKMRIAVNKNNDNDAYTYCKILMEDNKDLVSPFTLKGLQQMIVNGKADSLKFDNCQKIAISDPNAKITIPDTQKMIRILCGELGLNKVTGQPLKRRLCEGLDFERCKLENGTTVFRCLGSKDGKICHQTFKKKGNWDNHKRLKCEYFK